MSDETPNPPVLEETPAAPASELVLTAPPSKKKSLRWVSTNDLNAVVEILAAADKITPEEAVRRLNVMCEKGTLVIVPPFGVRK